jgi:hypothetical protein
VIKFDVRQNERVGKVVHELRTLVEEGCVVFIALDDEGPSLAQAEAGAKVFRHSSNQERGRQIGLTARGDFVNPSQHAGSCGFSVRTGNDQRFLALGVGLPDELVMHEARERGKRDALVQHVFHFDITARDGVADDDQVRRGVEIRL